MAGGAPEAVRTVVYCIVPRDLAGALHEPLRRHYREDPGVEVVVEQRGTERRSSDERRANASGEAVKVERRRIRGIGGRRVSERRAPLVESPDTPVLPRRARRHAARLAFVVRLEPAALDAEDADTARLVMCFQSGDREQFTAIYQRYFDRIYSHLRLVLNDPHGAEDATQLVFMRAFQGLDRYERRAAQPFRAWLFVIARNTAINYLSERQRLELMEDVPPARDSVNGEPAAEIPSWISDPDLMLFIERLPLLQRQVLVMRYMLDLSFAQIAEALGKREDNVRALNHRALTFLRQRLAAVDRPRVRGRGVRMIRCRDRATVLRARRFALME